MTGSSVTCVPGYQAGHTRAARDDPQQATTTPYSVRVSGNKSTQCFKARK